MNQEFEMTQEEMDNIIAINKGGGDPVMFLSGGVPMGSSLQEKINQYWVILGNKYGFKPMTAKGSSKGKLFFLAEPAPIDTTRYLSVKEALEQGYDRYCFNMEGFQGLRSIKDVTEEDLARDDIRIIEKDSYSPAGLTSKQIAEMLAEQIHLTHVDDTGDDTNTVYDVIKALDFTETEKKITKALSDLYYSRASDIKLVK
jgi:DNA-binding XRE family transcriptional regulator